MPWIAVLAWAMCLPAFAQPPKDPKPLKRGPTLTRGTKSILTMSDVPRASATPISLAAIAKAKGPATRMQTVGALLADRRTKQALDKATHGSGVRSSQLTVRTLAGRAASATAVTVTILDPDDALPTFEETDWDAGVHFSPLGSPRFRDGEGTYKLGALWAESCLVTPEFGLRHMYESDVLMLLYGAHAQCYVDLPPDTASYTVTIKLVPTDGTTAADWLARIDTDYRRCLQICDATGGSRRPDLVPLSDGSGLAAMLPITPAQDTLNGVYGLREADCGLSLAIPGLRRGGSDVLFGGITITRL